MLKTPSKQLFYNHPLPTPRVVTETERREKRKLGKEKKRIKNNQKRDGSTERLKKAKAKHETKIRNKMVLPFYIHSLTRRTQKRTKREKNKNDLRNIGH